MIIEEPKAAVDLLEPILDENQMCVEYRHVSAYVPAKVAAGGFFSGWELPKLTAKAKAKEKEKLRRVSLRLALLAYLERIVHSMSQSARRRATSPTAFPMGLSENSCQHVL